MHLVAKGWGAPIGTFAAVLADPVTQITLQKGLTSYRAIVETEEYECPASMMLPGVLQHYDLPDCYRALAAKKIRQIDPTAKFSATR